jgi:hypothetical protein
MMSTILGTSAMEANDHACEHGSRPSMKFIQSEQ